MFVPNKKCLVSLILIVQMLSCKASPPIWREPSADTTLEIDSTDSTQCDGPLIATLTVSPTDRNPAPISVHMEEPNLINPFRVERNVYTASDELKCVYNDLSTLQNDQQSGVFVAILRSTSSFDGAVAEIKVTITDLAYASSNDADPVISLPSQTIDLGRDAFEDGDILVTTLQVSDADGDTVALSLSDTTHFSINELNIEIISSLQDLNDPYELEIVATDSGDPSRSSTATVTLDLKHRPVFTNIAENDVIYMCETDYGGDDLFNLTATDFENGLLSFAIDNVDPNSGTGLFTISGDTLIVADGVTEGEFDVDAANAIQRYTIQLNVTNQFYNSSTTVIVTIEDFNDNQPLFNPPAPISIQISDSTAPGTSIYQVMVTDGDLTEENRNFSFSLQGSANFEINRLDGSIYLAATAEPLDYETQSEYSLAVTVNDTDDPVTVYPNEGSITVTVETAPEFTNLVSSHTEEISENIAIDSVVFTLIVQDKDTSPNSVSCNITEESQQGVFALNVYEVVLKTALDAESQTSYTLKFSCGDGKYDTESAVLTIEVTDLNDNEPSITVTNGMTFPENTSAIDVFTVSDADVQSPNNVVAMEITSGNDAGYFEIDENNKIAVVTTPKSMTYNVFQLVLQASDGGNPQLTSTATVTFTLDPDIIDECDQIQCANSASCTSFLNAFECNCTSGWKGTLCDAVFAITNPADAVSKNISESTAVDEVTFTLTVQDDDPSQTGATCIIMEESDPGVFELNNKDLILKTVLDAETQVSYTLKFKCTDGSFFTESAELTIQVTDVNDNSPSITVANVLNFEETASVIDAFTVSDNDIQSPNNMVTVRIISGNDAGYFEINGNNKIAVVTTPTSMTDNEFQLVLQASDGGNPQLTSTATVTFTFNTDTIDECDPTQCVNSDSCTSYLNAFECGCTPGWKGTLCDAECTDNKHGQDCSEDCDCNATRIASDKQDQMCNAVNGECRCNRFWKGTKCETDVDECETADICDKSAKLVCVNSIGSYSCICRTHYIDVDGVCLPNPEKNKIPEGKITTKNTISLPTPECQQRLEIPSVYNETRDKIKTAVLKNVNDVVNDVDIHNITCGSLNFIVVYYTNDTIEEALQLAKRLEEIKTSSVIYDGTAVPYSITNIGFTKAGSDSSIQTSRQICEGSDCYRCEGVNSIMTCRLIDDDNQALIWGLGAFMLGMIILGAILVIGIICYRKKKVAQEKRAHRKRQHSRSKFKPRVKRHVSDREFRSSKWHNDQSSSYVPKFQKSESFNEPLGASSYSFYKMQGLNDKNGFERPPLYSPY